MDISTSHLFNNKYQQTLLTVTPNTPALEVIQQMSQTQTSCALVTLQQQLVGIFTERDVVRVVANQTAFEEITIAALMTQPVITLSETDAEDFSNVLQKFHQHSIRHLPVINAQGQVLGVVTPASINHTVAKLQQETEARFHLIERIINHSPQLLYIFDLVTSSNVYLNHQSVEILGYSPEEIQQWGANFLFDMFHPDDLHLLERNFKYWKTATGDEVLTTEYRMKHQDGAWRWLRSREVVFARNENNLPTKVLGTIQDISESKQAELEIIHSRDLREAIFHESADALFLVNPETFLTTDCNHRAVELFAVSDKAELIGIDGQTLQKQRFNPDELTTFVEEINQQGFWSRELEYITKQGNSFWGNLAVKEIRVAGEVIHLVRVTDISDVYEELRLRKQAEAALAKSEEQLRLTLDFTHIGIWDWNVQTNEVIWNDNHFYLLGLEPETSVAKYQLWRNCVHPEDIARVEEALFQALTQHTDYESEYRVIYPNGQIRWLIGKGRGMYNQAGDPIRMLGVIIDISEEQEARSDRQRAEQALQAQEKFLRSIYDGVGQSIFVIDVLDDFRYAGLNPSHERLTGLTTADLQGKTPEQVLPGDAAAAVRQHYQDCVDIGESITYEECLTFREQETWWITSLTPLRDENSHIYRIIGNSVNITDRKRAEKMLDLQAVITRNMAEGICLVRATDGIIVYANPKFKQMFGYGPGELIGQHVSIVNYGDNHTMRQEVNQAIITAALQNGEVTYEVHNVKKDGTPFWCSATASVFEHPEYGTVLVAVQQDITEHKQAEEKIKASLQEKEVLLQEIHHRVKNNLGIVSSLLQMQCRRTEDPQATAILRDSQNRIASIALVHEKLYRSEDLAEIDFNQYIPDLTTHLFDSYNVSSRQIQLNIQVDHVSLDIETAIPCGLIINELVSNALKYAFPNNISGEIQVKFYQECECLIKRLCQRTLTLIIRDNGVGLPADFDRNKTKTLGLTLVQGLVQQLRGKMAIDCQQGTEFKIIFTKSRQ